VENRKEKTTAHHSHRDDALSGSVVGNSEKERSKKSRKVSTEDERLDERSLSERSHNNAELELTGPT
jgi:hypothetical protein